MWVPESVSGSQVRHSRAAGVQLVPSWVAVERVLYLSALDCCLRPTADDSARVLIAMSSMRAAIRRDGPRAYAECVADEADEARWLHALQDHLRPQGGAGIAALLWCAVGVWTDAGRAPWSRLAEAAERVVRAMPEDATGREAGTLGEAMADVWREMEAVR